MTASVPQGNWTLHPQKQNSCRTWASGCSTVDELTWSSKQSICLGQMALTVWVNRWAWIFIQVTFKSNASQYCFTPQKSN